MSSHPAPATAPVSVIVTAFERVTRTLQTISILKQCRPAPAEILVHVDGNQHGCAEAIRREHPDVQVLVSGAQIGPGGARNALIATAANAIVASFDDDSYPLDSDYLARVLRLFDEYPAAGIVDAHVFHPNQAIVDDADQSEWVADFSGGGCAYRRACFLEIGGYMPLPIAYGMEEVDFGVRLHARGGRVLRSRRLRVFHDTDLSRHAAPALTAATIANIALLAYLRYPRSWWVVAILQVLNRIAWLLRNGRWRGIVSGVAAIPGTIAAHRDARDPVSAGALRSYLSLRRTPVPATR